MRKLIISLAALITFPCLAQDSECNELLKLEKQFAAKLPMQIDEATTLVEVSVNCTTRIVKYVKHLSVGTDQLATGFAQRKQRQHANLHCNSKGLATNGWTAVDYIYDNQLSLAVKLETHPSMCQ